MSASAPMPAAMPAPMPTAMPSAMPPAANKPKSMLNMLSSLNPFGPKTGGSRRRNRRKMTRRGRRITRNMRKRRGSRNMRR